MRPAWSIIFFYVIIWSLALASQRGLFLALYRWSQRCICLRLPDVTLG